MSIRKNFAYLAQSKYLICIAMIVLAYNLGINLIEVVWKNQIKELYPNALEYNQYMGQVTTSMGIVATITAIFITGNVIRKFSWTKSAMVPVIIMLTTGAGFFFFLFFKDSGLTTFAYLFGTTPLVLTVFFGAMQNCLARASKYTLFDATKELSFIPLSNECKLKGKAAIDGVGSRIGKSGGSVIHLGLLMIFTTISASTPYIAAIFFGVMAVWMIAVIALGKQFNARVSALKSIPSPSSPSPISNETLEDRVEEAVEEPEDQEALV